MLSISSICIIGLVILYFIYYYKKIAKEKQSVVYQDRNFNNFINALQKQVKQEEKEK